MRVVVFSSTNFGYRCLSEALLELPIVELTGILTTPRQISFSRSKTSLSVCCHADFDDLAGKAGCEVAELADPVNSVAYRRPLDSWRPDLILVLGWYHIVPSSILRSIPLGVVGIHASLLPKNRGHAPIPWAIINGETGTGISLFYLDEEVDAGDIITQPRFPIEETDTCATVYEKATMASIKVLRQYLPLIAAGTAPRTRQDHSRATRLPRRTPEDGLIDWSQTTTQLYDFVRAQTHPYPGAFSFYRGRKFHVWQARKALCAKAVGRRAGDIVNPGNEVGVVTGDGLLVLEQCQFEGEENNFDPVDRFKPGESLAG